MMSWLGWVKVLTKWQLTFLVYLHKLKLVINKLKNWVFFKLKKKTQNSKKIKTVSLFIYDD